MSDLKEWYTNKDLFESITSLKSDLKETRQIIKQYNGLREKIETVEYGVKHIDDRVRHIETMSEARSGFGQSLRDWGGWIFALITLVILIYNI